jgi:hypothetical protein
MVSRLTKGSSIVEQPDVVKEDMKKLKKENQAYQESFTRLADHIFTQTTLLKAIGLQEELHEKLLQQAAPAKVKKAMEIISILAQVFS